MNFNFSNKPEYDLNSSLSKEMINLYGLVVKLVLIERINVDETVFGDYSHLKSSSNIIDLPVLPEDTDNWDEGSFNMTAFGPINYENINLFVHEDYITIDLNKIVGNLLVFPNNKVMEITYFDITVPGVNNLFTYKDTKTLIKLTCKPYNGKIVNELKPEDLIHASGDFNDPVESEDFESLEKYFDELMTKSEELHQETEVQESVQIAKPNSNPTKPDVVINKSLVNNSVDDVWGRF